MLYQKKQNKQPESYEPMVSVATKKSNGKVEINVMDNGEGFRIK